ncbi:LOC733347 protein-like protein [Neoconidiobolus thromboides FSU 785]|nr:LOC733347 protein-like protein [Neoconidiobolus thromboides FSU 785]
MNNNNNNNNNNNSNNKATCITIDESTKQELKQRKVGVSEFWYKKYSNEASKNWDKFYKRNGVNFFKDRHWIDKEFEELNQLINNNDKNEQKRYILEVGCGVGNFVYPVLNQTKNLIFYACDFSPRAVQFVKEHPEYNPNRCIPFVCDITKDDLSENVKNELDYVSCIFVISAIPPNKQKASFENIHKAMKPGGKLFFRDYAEYDAAEIRFKSSNKIDDQFYVRQDGTFSVYFNQHQFQELVQEVGFKVVEINYVHKKMENVKLGVKADRIFLQAVIEKC